MTYRRGSRLTNSKCSAKTSFQLAARAQAHLWNVGNWRWLLNCWLVFQNLVLWNTLLTIYSAIKFIIPNHIKIYYSFWKQFGLSVSSFKKLTLAFYDQISWWQNLSSIFTHKSATKIIRFGGWSIAIKGPWLNKGIDYGISRLVYTAEWKSGRPLLWIRRIEYVIKVGAGGGRAKESGREQTHIHMNWLILSTLQGGWACSIRLLFALSDTAHLRQCPQRVGLGGPWVYLLYLRLYCWAKFLERAG